MNPFARKGVTENRQGMRSTRAYFGPGCVCTVCYGVTGRVDSDDDSQIIHCKSITATTTKPAIVAVSKARQWPMPNRRLLFEDAEEGTVLTYAFNYIHSEPVQGRCPWTNRSSHRLESMICSEPQYQQWSRGESAASRPSPGPGGRQEST
jgi:hypothetical protein